jgi:hypothetical protein
VNLCTLAVRGQADSGILVVKNGTKEFMTVLKPGPSSSTKTSRNELTLYNQNLFTGIYLGNPDLYNKQTEVFSAF